MSDSVTETMREAVVSLEYAADALEASTGSHMRAVTRELKAARATVAAMLAALETIVAMDCWGASAEAMRLRLIVFALIKQAKGEE
jgi:hypothetical protein